jgi:hypothetical protein
VSTAGSEIKELKMIADRFRAFGRRWMDASVVAGDRRAEDGSSGCGRAVSRTMRMFTAILVAIAALVPATQLGATERSVIPFIDFSDPADAARLSVEKAKLSFKTGGRVNGGSTAAHVDFAATDGAQLMIRPANGAADWSGMQALAVPVENPTTEPVDLLLRLDDDLLAGTAAHSVTGRARLLAGEAVVLVLPLEATGAAAFGMLAAPPLEPPPLGAPMRMISNARGSIDRHHVAALHVMLPRLTSPRSLVFGDPGTISGAASEREAYERIVDAFGQYARAHWPGKVSSTTDIEEQRRREERELQQRAKAPPPLDAYGGLLEGPQFSATGFFHVAQRNGRWWLVTPEGHGFFSLGIDVVRPDIGATYVEGREFMFAEMPAPDDSLAVHFAEADHRLDIPSQHGRRFDHGRTFDFYAANLERKYGPNYLDAWRRMAIARLRAWGFNTIGNWSEPALLARHELPYVVPIHLYGNFAQVSSGSDWWGKMPDPFDPQFASAVNTEIGSAASISRDDSFLIGYFVDNELAWGLGNSADPQLRYGLAIHALGLGPDSPAKQAFIRLLAEKYGDTAGLATAWGVAASGSWDELAMVLSSEVLARDAVTSDLRAFTALYADAYFRIVAAAIRRHDPHHLYLGSRFQARTPEAVAACAKYCDVVSFNLYQREVAGEEWARFHLLGRPALIGEFHFGSTDRGLFWPGIYDVGIEEERGVAYSTFLQSVLANADIVGCHWFQYADEPLTGRLLDGENGHVGFVSVADVPYPALASAARTANLNLLHSLR